MSQFTSLQDIEDFFTQLSHKKNQYPPFQMVRLALKLLGQPEEALQYIHISGTNGKGSTSTYLSHFLTDSGLRVGLFTSPHLFNICERIKLNNQSIPVTDFIKHFNAVYNRINNVCSLIQFEWLYLIALEYFNAQQVDIVILEVGIGGARDTTNTIPHKLAAIITNVALDHEALLGTSLAAITTQKQGIITATTQRAFIGNITDQTLLALIHERLNETQTPGYFLFEDFWYDAEAELFVFGGMSIQTSNSTLAPFQYENIALALAVADNVLTHFHKRLDLDAAQTTIHTWQMPIRFEVVRTGSQIYIFDGAHNVAGTQTMIEALQRHFPGHNYLFVYAAMADKAYEAMLGLLEAHGTVVLFDFQPIYQRAFDVHDARAQPVITTVSELRNLASTHENSVIVYVGSMYFVAYIRELFHTGILP
jgi:dihydrofolate synthase/folylpolyglutamate synthase